MLECDTTISAENFEIICRDNINTHLKIKESIFIKREDPSMNIRGKSIPLTLF